MYYVCVLYDADTKCGSDGGGGGLAGLVVYLACVSMCVGCAYVLCGMMSD